MLRGGLALIKVSVRDGHLQSGLNNVTLRLLSFFARGNTETTASRCALLPLDVYGGSIGRVLRMACTAAHWRGLLVSFTSYGIHDISCSFGLVVKGNNKNQQVLDS